MVKCIIPYVCVSLFSFWENGRRISPRRFYFFSSLLFDFYFLGSSWGIDWLCSGNEKCVRGYLTSSREGGNGAVKCGEARGGRERGKKILD